MPLRHAEPPWTTSLTTICRARGARVSGADAQHARFRAKPAAEAPGPERARPPANSNSGARRARRREGHLRGVILRGHEEQPDAGARCHETRPVSARVAAGALRGARGALRAHGGQRATNRAGPASAAHSCGAWAAAWAAACAVAGRTTSCRGSPVSRPALPSGGRIPCAVRRQRKTGEGSVWNDEEPFQS